MKQMLFFARAAAASLFLLFVHCPFSGSSDDSGVNEASGILAILLNGTGGTPGVTPSPSDPVLPTLPEPGFSPAPAPTTYSSTQDVRISATNGATIYFTDNGSTPVCPSQGTTAVGKVFGGAISVPSTITFKAIACKTGWKPSPVATAEYIITGTVAAPTFSVDQGKYTFDISPVLLTTTPSAQVVYTADKSDPTCPASSGGPYHGTMYASPIPLKAPSSGQVTIRAIACRTGWTSSSITEATYDLTSTIPTYAVLPVSGSRIKTTGKIVIQFSESMRNNLLSQAGTLGTAAMAWKKTQYANDTLEITPQPVYGGTASWNPGDGRTLTISSLQDTSYNSVAPISLTYDVGALIYVSKSGQSPYDGQTPATAMGSINAAILSATKGDRVLVAEGTYSIDGSRLDSAGPIIIKNGVSVYGGYSFDFLSRDPAMHITTIADTCSNLYSRTGTGACMFSVSIVSVTAPTVLDGFTITGPTGLDARVIFANGSDGITISNNIIRGGRSQKSGGTWGPFNSTLTIQLNSSDAVLIGNTIDGGREGDFSTALSVSDSSPTIRNNVLDGGSGSFSTAIQTLGYSSGGFIQNNTVFGGSGTTSSQAISLGTKSLPAIDNNILFAEPTSTMSNCVGLVSSDASPISLRSNVMWGCKTLYRNFTAMCSGNPGNADCSVTLAAPVGTGNLRVDPAFVNQAAGNWRLSAGSGCSVTQGGIDLSPEIAVDHEGTPRTAPLSIGAFEWDGACL